MAGGTMCENEQPSITRWDYWNDFYKNELSEFRNSGHKGEEWFETETDSLVDWIVELPGIDPNLSRVIDIGCGNALLLVRLAEVGFKHLAGCDYIPSAIDLAYEICLSLYTTDETTIDGEQPLKIHLSVMDIASPSDNLLSNHLIVNHCITEESTKCNNSLIQKKNEIKMMNCQELCLHKFDFIHDKGTFDVFFMSGKSTRYLESICRYFIKPGSVVCISSCNATEVELVELVTSFIGTIHPLSNTIIKENQMTPCRFVCISCLPHRSISFNGMKGQVISTAAFKVEKLV